MSGQMSALGRAAYAVERNTLRDSLLSAYQSAVVADGRSIEGRKRVGLRAALKIMGVDPDQAREGTTSYNEEIGEVGAPVDWVTVGIGPFDGDDRDPMPVRVVVIDGAMDATAAAYLSLDDAATVVELLTEAIATVERRWAGDPP